MNLVTDINNFNSAYIYICEPIRNNILNEGNFLRLLYTTPLFTLNGIVFELPIKEKDFVLENSSGHNNNYSFCSISNSFEIDKFKKMEESILESCRHCFPLKCPQFKLFNTLNHPDQTIKVFHEKKYSSSTMHQNDQSIVLLLKVSGLWETPDLFGLTFKFVSAQLY